MNALTAYANWLHLRWPAGTVEKLPEARADGSTNVPGLYVVGDLTGIPLLKFALDGGARAVRTIVADPAFRSGRQSTGVHDLVILGAGVAGMAAAMEARRQNLHFEILEAAEAWFTLVNFPKAKPIYAYPLEMTPAGDLQISADVKEALVEELREQVDRAGIEHHSARAESVERAGHHRLRIRLAGGESLEAHRVIVAIGRSGNFRKLHVPGEDLAKVYNRLHDPGDFAGRQALVVGGGDSALEAAIALAEAGARVTLSYRKKDFSRPKSENLERLQALARQPDRLRLKLGTQVRAIRPAEVDLAADDRGPTETLPNDVVFVAIGREAPLDFFRRSGVRIAGEMTPRHWTMLGLFLLFCTWLYDWKSGGFFSRLWYQRHWFPVNLAELTAGWGLSPTGLAGITLRSAGGPSFWYTLAYTLLVVIFGVKRMRLRRTPYVRAQTLTLMAVQILPLFLLPEIILPWLNYHGLLPPGLADALFPQVDYGHGREFWRAYGLILAWPLMIYNIFTDQPLWWWIGIGAAQTLVLIPLGVYYFGKGAYCGWVCSCGALAETLGDGQRQKMPHGPVWNRWNMVGQGILAVAFLLLFVRIAGWIWPGSWAASAFHFFKDGWKWIVDVFLAGIVGYGLYFWFSGRIWCRFFCPLAALMHIYARFSRFRILADKKKCISCNVCTSVCHQGIDIMNFANKGLPMADPECVRCSACVQMCPTGVLTFGQVDWAGRVVRTDRLAASPVQMSGGH